MCWSLDEFELESVAKTAITGKAAEHDIDNVARLCVEAVERFPMVMTPKSKWSTKSVGRLTIRIYTMV